MEIKRRDFLKLFGGLSGAVLAGGCNWDDVLALPQRMLDQARNGPGIETWQNTVCGLCPAGCGMRVRLIDQIPVYVRGNTVNPVNRGGLCPLGLNALHSLYHPDRLTGPMRRKGPRGNGTWEQISWDEALQAVSQKLIELRDAGRPHEVGFLGNTERGVMRDHIARFMEAYGSPNYFHHSSAQYNSIPIFLQQGHPSIPAYDILNAKMILSLGANVLEEGYSPVYYTKLYSHHQEQQTQYVMVDSRMSLTAANADQWIPIRPGTYAALALGIAYVLIREELYDASFVRSHTYGFEDWVDQNGVKHTGFRSLVFGNYYPERVSEITGIPSATILQLGRTLGMTRPSVVLCDQPAVANTNGFYTAMAAHALNALLGNFEQEGGVFLVDDVPFQKPARLRLDTVARAGNKKPRLGANGGTGFPQEQFSFENLTKGILSDSPYPLSVLFVHGGNPLFESVNHREFISALQKVPFIVSFDQIVNETSEYADLILPDDHFLERWDEVSSVESVGFMHVGLQHPVVNKLYDTRHAGDVLIELSRKIGGRVAEAFPYSTYKDRLTEALRGVFDSGRGATFSEGIGTHWIEYLRQRGWQIDRYASFDEFMERLASQGGWWDPVRRKKSWRQIFRTASGRFEFYSQTLKKGIQAIVSSRAGGAHDEEVVLNELNISARGDQVCLPHHEPVPYDVDAPVNLVTFRVLPVQDGQGAHLPMMQEMFGYGMNSHWETWGEIHPETAAQFGVVDGSMMWIESIVGTVKVRAKVTHGVLPNVVAVPFGLGHTSYGRYAKGHGANPNSIMRNLHDMVTGRPASQATKVKIYPAT